MTCPKCGKTIIPLTFGRSDDDETTIYACSCGWTYEHDSDRDEDWDD